MDHLIPTLLGIAGALAPVALEYWRLARPVESRPSGRSAWRGRRSHLDPSETLVRGGRVYLYS